MSHKRHIIKKTIVTLLMASLVMMLAMSVAGTTASAEPDSETGELMIVPTEANSGVAYSVYQIFSASSATDDALYGFEWSSDAMAQAVCGAIGAEEPAFDGTIAQSSAEFIAEAFGDTALGTTVVSSDTFAWRLADAIYKANPPHTTLEPSQAGTLPIGYYLVMTDPESFDDFYDESGVSPIFATVSTGKRTQVGEKTDRPTITKQVKERDAKSWGKRTVAGTDEDVEFLMTVTLPSNYATFPTYCIEVSDDMEDMELRGTDDVHVLVDGIETDKFDVSYKDGRMVARIDDVKSAFPSVTSASVITIEYIAHLTSGAGMGTTGNTNTATLRYTRAPNSPDLGTATPSTATVYSWGLQIVKQEASERATKLEGAEFTVAIVKDYHATDSMPSKEEYAGYVTEDGSIVPQSHPMRTNAEGVINIPNIPSGAYVISETQAPDGYEPIANDISVILVNKSDDEGMTGPYDLEATLIGDYGYVTMDAEESANSGIVVITVGDEKTPEPPAPSEPPATPVTPALQVLGDLVQTGLGRATLVGVVAAIAISTFLASRWLRHKSRPENDIPDDEARES